MGMPRLFLPPTSQQSHPLHPQNRQSNTRMGRQKCPWFPPLMPRLFPPLAYQWCPPPKRPWFLQPTHQKFLRRTHQWCPQPKRPWFLQRTHRKFLRRTRQWCPQPKRACHETVQTTAEDSCDWKILMTKVMPTNGSQKRKQRLALAMNHSPTKPSVRFVPKLTQSWLTTKPIDECARTIWICHTSRQMPLRVQLRRTRSPRSTLACPKATTNLFNKLALRRPIQTTNGTTSATRKRSNSSGRTAARLPPARTNACPHRRTAPTCSVSAPCIPKVASTWIPMCCPWCPSTIFTILAPLLPSATIGRRDVRKSK